MPAVDPSDGGDDAEQVDDLGLAAYEAMANVVDHAYDRPGGVFDLHACRSGDTVTVSVTDHGRWSRRRTARSSAAVAAC
jgi:anti-sigma regulatory factor (Ser/Thr protein kinase)